MTMIFYPGPVIFFLNVYQSKIFFDKWEVGSSNVGCWLYHSHHSNCAGIHCAENCQRVIEEIHKSFYNISDEVEGVNVGKLIQRRVFGVPPMPGFLSSIVSYQFIVIDKDKLDEKFSWAYSLGGPAKLIVYDGFAVYLERGGKLSRVVGSGIAFLERFETIRDIIDLRPQIKDISIEAWSKDGIQMTIHVHLECQILSTKDAESSQKLDISQNSRKTRVSFL